MELPGLGISVQGRSGFKVWKSMLRGCGGLVGPLRGLSRQIFLAVRALRLFGVRGVGGTTGPGFDTIGAWDIKQFRFWLQEFNACASCWVGCLKASRTGAFTTIPGNSGRKATDLVVPNCNRPCTLYFQHPTQSLDCYC